MTRIERSIEIDAAVERVFDELANWDGLTRWSTVTGAHSGPPRCTRAGEEFDQTLHVAGVPIESHWRVTEYQRPNIIAYEADGPAGSWLRMRQEVVAVGGASRVTFEVEYDVPGGVLGDVVDRVFVEGRNEHEAERSLQNLKELLEGHRP